MREAIGRMAAALESCRRSESTVRRAQLRYGGAILDDGEVSGDGGLAYIERVGFAGLPTGGGVGLVERVVEFSMVRQQGGRAKFCGCLRHLPRRSEIAIVKRGVAVEWDRRAADVRDPQWLAFVFHLEEEGDRPWRMARHRDYLNRGVAVRDLHSVGGDHVVLRLAADVVRRSINRVPVRSTVEEMRGRHES